MSSRRRQITSKGEIDVPNVCSPCTNRAIDGCFAPPKKAYSPDAHPTCVFLTPTGHSPASLGGSSYGTCFVQLENSSACPTTKANRANMAARGRLSAALDQCCPFFFSRQESDCLARSPLFATSAQVVQLHPYDIFSGLVHSSSSRRVENFGIDPRLGRAWILRICKRAHVSQCCSSASTFRWCISSR